MRAKKCPGQEGSLTEAGDEEAGRFEFPIDKPSRAECTPLRMIDAALAYAAKGIPVFPCGANKAPLTTHGFKDAVADPDQVRAWWTKHPDAWIGMPTGKASGFDVLDLDHKGDKDGFAQVPGWNSLSRIIAMTPSGGAHLYFKADGVKCSSDQVANGVDTRGDGGYVIVPPSPGYRWRNGGIP